MDREKGMEISEEGTDGVSKRGRREEDKNWVEMRSRESGEQGRIHG